VSEERVRFEVIEGVIRKLTPITGIEGCIVVTARVIAFIGPAASHPLKGGAQPGFSKDTPLGGLFDDEEESELDSFMDFRAGRRTLREQIEKSKNVEKKIAQLRKYRRGSVRIRRRSVRELGYRRGKFRVTGRKGEYVFAVPDDRVKALKSALMDLGYIGHKEEQ